MGSDIKNLKKVKSFDFDVYDGQKTKIASVEMLPEEEKDFGEGKKKVRQILITTDNLSDDTENPVTAREYVALKMDKDGEWGIPDNQNSKAMRILNYFNASNFDEIVGKECMAVKRVVGDKTVLGIHGG